MFGFVPSSSYSPYASAYSAPPRRAAPAPAPTTYTYSPFGGFVPVQPTTSSPFDPFGLDDYYDPYAARRAALERQALLEEQQRQAAIEEQERRRQILLQRERRRQQQQAEEEAEYIRRQLALQQAIEEEERARYRAAVKAAREEERRRREAIERRQEEILRRQREEEAAKQAAQQQQQEEVDEEDEEDEEDVYSSQEEFGNPFFSWLYPRAAFARRHQQRPRSTAQRKQSSQPQPQQQAQSNTKNTSPTPVPVVESVRSVSPTPESDHATFAGPTVEDVTSVDPAEAVDAAPAPSTNANDNVTTSYTDNNSPAASTLRPATPQPSAEQMEAAARAVQSAWKHHHQRQAQLTKLATLSAELDSRRDEFAPQQPAQLDFEPPIVAGGQLKLAYSKTNAPFRGFEDALVKLLSKVDEVQSGGDREVKKARKALVAQIEAELARLDAHRERLAQEWKDSNPQAAATPATADADATAEAVFNGEDAEMTDESADADADAETSSTVSVDSIDAKVAMMEDLLTASKAGKVRRDGRAHSQKKRLPRKSRKHREGARGVDRV